MASVFLVPSLEKPQEVRVFWCFFLSTTKRVVFPVWFPFNSHKTRGAPSWFPFKATKTRGISTRPGHLQDAEPPEPPEPKLRPAGRFAPVRRLRRARRSLVARTWARWTSLGRPCLRWVALKFLKGKPKGNREPRKGKPATRCSDFLRQAMICSLGPEMVDEYSFGGIHDQHFEEPPY